jgi:phosphomethylpyrimidine synthase
MKISQDIKNLDNETIVKIQEIQIEMDKKSEEFINNDSEIYLKEGA